ncbi:hypothetical protein HDU83_008485 [Entophlyctis luteolus]|nr:hypothetical protein HDU83_008485 [Entophlyctis luteolus]
MQFLLVARDFTDAGALARRLAVRQAHLDRAALAKKEGVVLFGGATLDADDPAVAKMSGSVLLYEFPSRAMAEQYIQQDPYIIGKVWESYTLTPFRMAPLPKQ